MSRRSSLALLAPLLGLLVCLGACAAPATSAVQPTFGPVRAFAGHSQGNGTLSVIFQSPRPFHVESRGFARSDGTFRLDQTVTFAGEPPRKRHWLLKKTSPANYAGTLSDAAGPVRGTTEGAQLRLVYALPGDLTMHQTLTLEPGGNIDNIGRIMFLGVQIGYLHETIERKRAVKVGSEGVVRVSSSRN